MPHFSLLSARHSNPCLQAQHLGDGGRRIRNESSSSPQKVGGQPELHETLSQKNKNKIVTTFPNILQFHKTKKCVVSEITGIFISFMSFHFCSCVLKNICPNHDTVSQLCFQEHHTYCLCLLVCFRKIFSFLSSIIFPRFFLSFFLKSNFIKRKRKCGERKRRRENLQTPNRQ